MSRRVAKRITEPNDINEILSLKPGDITKSKMMELFGEFDGKTRFNPYDEIIIPKDTFGSEKPYMNSEDFLTTVGLWIFNIYFISERFIPILGYVQNTINKKMYGKINTTLGYALLEDDITSDDMDYFIIRVEKFMPFVNILSPTMTEEVLMSSIEANKKLNELYKNKYKERIDNKDPFAMSQLEKDVLDHMKDYLKDDPGMDLYNSGAAGSFGNNYKNMFVSKGAVKDPETGEYNNIMSNYVNGISKKEYPLMANSLSAGPYSRAKLTALGGYKEKIFTQAFQHVVLDDPGSDCHTKRYIEVDLTSNNISKYMYCYVIEGSELVEITRKNQDKFIGKRVKMRFSNMCESKTGYCNKCAGNLFYRLGFKNVGLILSSIPAQLKQKTMKSFHDSVVEFAEMDPMAAFFPKF